MKQLTLGTRKFEATTKYTTIFTFVSVGNEFEFHFLYSSVCLCVCACQHAMHAQFNLGITDLWFVEKKWNNVYLWRYSFLAGAKK